MAGIQTIDYPKFVKFLSNFPGKMSSDQAADVLRFFNSVKLSGLDPESVQHDINLYKKSFNSLQNSLINHIIKSRNYDYGVDWYATIKKTINDVNFRYTTQKLIHRDTTQLYRTFFKLYCRLIEEGIYDSQNPLNLFYFFTAQYSGRCHPEKGLLVKMHPDLFKFDTAINYYNSFIHYGRPPSLLKPHTLFLFYKGKRPPRYGHREEELIIPDIKSGSFVSVELPVIERHLPKFEDYTAQRMRTYMRSLEFLMIRAAYLGREYNRLILNIEHLRSYKYARATYPNAISST